MLLTKLSSGIRHNKSMEPTRRTRGSCQCSAAWPSKGTGSRDLRRLYCLRHVIDIWASILAATRTVESGCPGKQRLACHVEAHDGVMNLTGLQRVQQLPGGTRPFARLAAWLAVGIMLLQQSMRLFNTLVVL